MPSYDEWNEALIAYCVQGLAREAPILLSVDEEVLQQVGRAIGLGNTDPGEDFRHAVRDRVVDESDLVHVDRVYGYNAKGEPAGVAFLAAMVLAAHQMEEWHAQDGEAVGRDHIGEINYFTRLRQVLHLPTADGGRPSGMRLNEQPEEPLWIAWARWLRRQGFRPTAQRGPEGPKKFIHYPLSQALLRAADRERLRTLFQERHWRFDWDVETLLYAVKRERDHLTQHLRGLLDPADTRYDAVAGEIHEIHRAWLAAPDMTSIDLRERSAGTDNTRLIAGLFREEDVIHETLVYRLYPRMPRRQHVPEIRVTGRKGPITLPEHRSGWYWPKVPLSVEELDSGIEFPVEEPRTVEAVVLPKRDFWILTPDRDDPESGVYASWGAPSLGEPFLLLCKQELLPQLETLRSELLIQWSDSPPRHLAPEFDWIELQYCMIRSEAWKGVRVPNQQLYEALRPKRAVSVSVAGGLRAPNGAGWLAGHGPQVRIVAFRDEAHVRVLYIRDEVEDDQEIHNETRETNRLLDLPWAGAGDYLVEAKCGGDVASRLIRIVSWDTLRLVVPTTRNMIELDGARICGACIQTEV